MTILEHLPAPSKRHIAIRVKPSAERTLRRGHPWLFDQSITRQNHPGKAGDLAVIFDRNNRFLAVGLYDPYSPIRVRVLQEGDQAEINSDWIEEKLETAAALRLPLNDTDTTGYRLVHGENDGLPGLVIDRYDRTFVISLDTTAWIPYLKIVTEWLSNQYPLEREVLRMSRNVSNQTDVVSGLQDGQLLIGTPVEDPVLFTENGIRFSADVVRGQKTGFFFDQRDNRALLEKTLEKNPHIKNMLNVFAYTGGFSLYAARAGVNNVTNIDSSAAALKIAEYNALLNNFDRMPPGTKQIMVVGDAFEVLEDLYNSGESYNMIVVDPPSFAKRKKEVKGAIEAYRQLARLSIRLVQKGGILVTASCSSRVSREEFFSVIGLAAGDCGRYMVELSRTGHPIDHPISFPEGEYLKCLFAVIR